MRKRRLEQKYTRRCSEKVVEVESEKIDVKYFSDVRDILMSDGSCPYNREVDTSWPLILYDLKLHPSPPCHCQEAIPKDPYSSTLCPPPKRPAIPTSFSFQWWNKLIKLS